MNTISNFIRNDVKQFIEENMPAFQDGVDEYGYLDITFGTNGELWNYQTGDNSFYGGAYGLEYWAVHRVTGETTSEDLFSCTIEQWEELLNS